MKSNNMMIPEKNALNLEKFQEDKDVAFFFIHLFFHPFLGPMRPCFSKLHTFKMDDSAKSKKFWHSWFITNIIENTDCKLVE